MATHTHTHTHKTHLHLLSKGKQGTTKSNMHSKVPVFYINLSWNFRGFKPVVQTPPLSKLATEVAGAVAALCGIY